MASAEPKIPVQDEIVFGNDLPLYSDILGINEASGLDLFEGDIKIEEGKERSTIIGSRYRWPLTVPYYLEDSLEVNAKDVILKAFERFWLKTCINFEPWNGEANYISVFKDNGCYSYVGNLQRGKQYLSIGSGCDDIKIVQHELLHALGFYHEQSRSDRDDYLTIINENIQPGKEHNFNAYSDVVSSFLNVPYDYLSIMHYDKTAFQIGQEPTILPKFPQFTNLIGKQMDFSDNDILKLNRLYNCTSSVTFLDTCSFETDDICGMLQNSSDSADWQRVTQVSNGPSSDHTHLGKERDIGYFMHFSTSTGKTGDYATLESRLFYPARRFQCLDFFYYHNGNKNDTLNIWIKEYTKVHSNGIWRLMDSINGKPADYWQLHYSSLHATNKFRIVFEGIKGFGKSDGGFSIDDINLSETVCPENVWHIRNFSRDNVKNYIRSPPYYSKDGYAYQIGLYEYSSPESQVNIATYLHLISGANDHALQWPCPWRQATVEFLDQHPNAQQRTSNMKSITTDPNLLSDNKLEWDNPSVIGINQVFPNGTYYKTTKGMGKFLFTTEEWLYRRDFLKGGDAFILISMEDISHLTQSQPLPQPTPSWTSKVPILPIHCQVNICQNNGVCVVENFKSVCRCITSGEWWYVGERCETRIPSKGNMWKMSFLCAMLLSLFSIILVNTA
ncbi:meprin A subunit beta-like isoform X2 [Hyla sarda]|uniref:meprin A subunit beta-like isoform X2 n=1 Tax=Hyla sarda TaxID=327740 RepID=UPI0024C22846|nr:meprin A subunit beta-like isoform X2 [Hyla sarda]